ncbi:DUF5960 family protein [Listeria seeligeri]|uniref:DUF5960 family protein n=1 Tax=Listeria seeligeri TaxID=1640 RepID=UPI002892E2D2|nr:DUF5960 family protein [Listeria seeligeri]
MSLDTNDLEFEYHTTNSEQFTKDFMNHVKTDIPLFALQDELLYLMNKRNSTSFRIPAYKSIDNRNHIFYFEIRPIKENPRLKVYQYKGIDLLH